MRCAIRRGCLSKRDWLAARDARAASAVQQGVTLRKAQNNTGGGTSIGRARGAPAAACPLPRRAKHLLDRLAHTRKATAPPTPDNPQQSSPSRACGQRWRHPRC